MPVLSVIFGGMHNDTVHERHRVPGEMTFCDVGMLAKTDKIAGREYQTLYEKYLQPLRHTPVRLLEIGLGCNMAYGPGHPVALWTQCLSHKKSSVSFVEFYKDCAERHRATTVPRWGRAGCTWGTS